MRKKSKKPYNYGSKFEERRNLRRSFNLRNQGRKLVEFRKQTDDNLSYFQAKQFAQSGY